MSVAAVAWGVLGYYYVSFSRLIDQSLHGERDKTFPQVFARPLEIYRGQSLTNQQLIDRLNDLGYAQRPKPEKPGEFVGQRRRGVDRPAAAGVQGPGRPGRLPAARRCGGDGTAERPAPLSDHVMRLQLGSRATSNG